MTCDNCPGTVWFDHSKSKWHHSSSTAPTDCKRPEPRAATNERRTS